MKINFIVLLSAHFVVAHAAPSVRVQWDCNHAVSKTCAYPFTGFAAKCHEQFNAVLHR
ncbi:hypothetical protein PGTUg99_011360 [Puccinia graminis f. sp. tritici]|uniref:Uncharacterized protein n=1 Tax=Puccinia graminis f. sp. tritici TaxID=56615 RepID=A0A5B0PWH4_PUCGR|nr:hypothetical protein PGTUg99_011360 [Puccinia graminis f. sp. tritici]